MRVTMRASGYMSMMSMMMSMRMCMYMYRHAQNTVHSYSNERVSSLTYYL